MTACDLYDSLFIQSFLQHSSGSDVAYVNTQDGRVHTRSLWQQFLDDLCFLCDSKPAGKSVVSIAVEQRRTGIATFWIATSPSHQWSAQRHLTEVLRLLARCSVKHFDANQTAIDITRSSVERSRSRIQNYVKMLERILSGEAVSNTKSFRLSGKMFEEANMAQKGLTGIEADVVLGLKAILNNRGCHLSLCKAAHDFRHSDVYNWLKSSTDEGLHRFRSSARHVLARLGHWHKTAQSIVTHASDFVSILQDAVVQSVPPPGYNEVRLKLDEDLRDLVMRVFPGLRGSSMCESLLDRILKAESLISWFRSACAKGVLRTRPHAEVVMLKFFHKAEISFVNDDKYIACSKPSCHCCALYFLAHPWEVHQRPGHGNVWVQWAVPYWPEWSPIDSLDINILRRMTDMTGEMSRASWTGGARPLRRYESTIGITTVRTGSVC